VRSGHFDESYRVSLRSISRAPDDEKEEDLREILHKNLSISASVLVLAVSLAHGQALPKNNQSGDPTFNGTIADTIAASKPGTAYTLKAKPGSPNVVYIVLDDVGFADLGAYGSEINTPNINRLAANGVRFNNFHTRAICSPTRGALLTGRNSHTIGINTVADLLNGFPNGRGRISPHATTVAQVLQTAGYATYALGKWHLMPAAEKTPAGPFTNWPLQKVFDHFYGFLGGYTDQYHPDLYQDSTPVDPSPRPGYHLSEDLVDHAVEYVRTEKVSAPEKPFFLYLAFGAAHAPIQVPESYIQKYLPVFEKGWDKTRADRFARQKELGITPANTVLTPPNPGVKPRDSLSADEKRLFVRHQAAFAGFVEHTDAQIGRLLDTLEETKQLDNTIIVIISDNGANPEGGFDGFTNIASGYLKQFLDTKDSDGLKQQLAVIDDIGTERTSSNYPRGWAQAGNTPFRLYKEFITGGGVNDPLIVHWPKGFAAKGEIRKQFVDVIDITPTIYDAVGVSAPKNFRGVDQLPIDGKSFLPVLRDATKPNQRNVQYFELHGNRAIWQDGWKAISLHTPGEKFDEEPWQLYDLNTDFSESKDLAAQEPARLEALRKLWWKEAKARGVLPLSDNAIEVAVRAALGRTPKKGLPPVLLHQGDWRVPSDVLGDYSLTPFAVEARIKRDSADANGVLVSVGDWNSGWILYVKNGAAVLDVNSLGKHFILNSKELPLGASVIRAEVKRGGLRLLVDGVEVASATGPTIQASLYGQLQVGRNIMTPVAKELFGTGFFEYPAGGILDVTITQIGQ
jgi:arylsulfatase A-like enzyme